MDRSRDDTWDDMNNCHAKVFLDLEDELWAKLYPKQANAVGAQEEGKYRKKTVMAADRRSSTNNRDKGEDLRAYFGNCDGDVMNIASPEVQTYK